MLLLLCCADFMLELALVLRCGGLSGVEITAEWLVAGRGPETGSMSDMASWC